MAPVLKVDPNNGNSLDKAKTAEQVIAEEAARIQALAEYKERVKTKKPRKAKATVEPEEVLATPSITIVKKDIPVKVNPFTAPNGEINVEELIEPLNAVLKQVEDTLKLITKGYKLTGEDNKFTTKVSIPDKFQYKPGVTHIKNNKEEAFNLNKPGVVSLNYNETAKDMYIDRVALKPLDVKELLKYPDKAYEAVKDLVVDNMFKNLWEAKKLDPKKKYFGTTIATLKRPGMGENYCFKTSGDVDFLEIRLFSDATELPEGK